ncbi:MAG: glycosyltransferase family 2 protein [Candidatus Cryptobacteroides sp.]
MVSLLNLYEMNGHPKISIVVPVYGAEKYIEHCAVSIFEQTYEETEFIFVNDGTPDLSMDILRSLIERKYSHLKSRIKLIDQSNQGAPFARKNGVMQASGDYIFFVDSDDWIEPDAAEEIGLHAKESDADLIYFGFFKEKKHKTVIRYDKNFQEKGKMEFIKALYTRETYGYNVIKCFKRKLYLHEPLYWPEKWMLDDIFLVTQLLYFSQSMYRLEKPLYHYRRTNPNSATRQKKGKKRMESSINMMDLYMSYRDNLSESPIQDVYGHILFYTAWNAIFYRLPLFEMFPDLEDDIRKIRVTRKNLLPFFKQLTVKLFLAFRSLNHRS